MDDLLRLSRVSRGDLKRAKVDLSRLARDVIKGFEIGAPDRRVQVRIDDDLETDGDPGLLRILMENLLSNAWKYTSKISDARIEFGTAPQQNGTPIYCVRDNGVGFPMQYVDRLFQPFQRLHRQEEFPGTGIGLTTVQRIIQRHGGKIWAESSPNNGATFYFSVNG
jgi:signal transduction histidine kinase